MDPNNCDIVRYPNFFCCLASFNSWESDDPTWGAIADRCNRDSFGPWLLSWLSNWGPHLRIPAGQLLQHFTGWTLGPFPTNSCFGFQLLFCQIFEFFLCHAVKFGIFGKRKISLPPSPSSLSSHSHKQNNGNHKK